MKRPFLIYAALILICNPVLWGLGIGLVNGLCNAFLLSLGSVRTFDTPIRLASLCIAAFSPVLIWPVAGAVWGADLFRWRFLQKHEQ